MKKLFKKAVLGGVVLSLGLVVGFAASTAFQDLDAVRDNFDYILNLNTSKQAEIDGLNITIAHKAHRSQETVELKEYLKMIIDWRDELIRRVGDV